MSDVLLLFFFLRYLLVGICPNLHCVCAFTGSKMRLRHHRHGSVLVYRVYASGCHCPSANYLLPHDGHHEGRKGTVHISVFTWANMLLCEHVSSAACYLKTH